MLGTAIDAGANHSVTNWLSTGPNGGNGAFDASVEGFSDDGTRSFFQTDEKMVAADTDDSIDIYERSGNTTTLISTGPNGGNGDFGADFFDASKDGSRVAFETNESLVAADNDGGFRDVYERANGVTSLVSFGPTAGGSPIDAFFLGMSQDGLHIYFMSYEPLVSADDDSGRRDVYERFNGTTSLVSTGPATTNALVEATWGGATPGHAAMTYARDVRGLSWARSEGGTTEMHKLHEVRTNLVIIGPTKQEKGLSTAENAR